MGDTAFKRAISARFLRLATHRKQSVAPIIHDTRLVLKI